MDIDIDVSPSFDRTVFPWTRASQVHDGRMSAHVCGVYPQRVPVDPATGLCAVPYEVAEELGYLKIDFLHLTVYQHFTSRAEVDALLARAPDWALLQLSSNHPKLFQLANHGELLQRLRPTSLEELADVLALIRPGKRQLQGLYLKDRATARRLLWARDDGGYAFKKSHALGYALVIVLQLHLIEQGRL